MAKCVYKCGQPFNPRKKGASTPKGHIECYNKFRASKPPERDVPKISDQVAHDKKIAGLKAEVHQLQRKYKESIKQSNVSERIVERLEQGIAALPVVPAPAKPKIVRGQSVESAVLVGSCWHIGEKIDRQEMGDLNEYNFDIFVRRLQFLIEKAITFTQDNMKSHTFEELHLFLTGDMVSGIIHEELVETNELHIVDQCLLGALVVAQAIQDLARVFPRVTVTGVVGNHGRTQQQKQFKHKGTKSWDYVFYNTLALLLRNQENVTFIIPKSYWAVVEVQGHLFQIQHGDTIKSWGGIPFYGLNRETSKWVEIHATQGRFIRYYVTSHFHTKAILQSGYGERIMNGSLKGGDEYAIGLGLYGDPIQLLFGVHPKHGKSWELSLNAKYAEILEPRYRYDVTQPLAFQMESLD
jgi:hypothetical protein